MAVPFPQHGNSKLADRLFLDDDVAGQIVFSDYFEEAGPGTDALTASGVDAGAPSVGTPAIGQVHALGADGISTVSPSVGFPLLQTAAADAEVQGGGWLSEEQVSAYRKRKDKKRSTVDELNRQIERAYRKVNGIAEPETFTKAAKSVEKARTVIARAEQLSAALSVKATEGENFNAAANGFLSNIRRLVQILEYERRQREYELKLEEEAIVLLLAA